ncbi:MAG: sigma 54-interacting transcriptional regulator [Desulfobacterales bacterium]|nr:sigma 54-interacting transcriptional regulator [Desulfobacterales bacterium]
MEGLEAVDISFGDFHPLLNAMDQGVLIVDRAGTIVFCNDYHCRMDGLKAADILGKKIVDVYELDDKSSLLMRAVRSETALHNMPHIYEARNGKFVNGINNIFPLIKHGKVIGAISFVKEYEYLDGLINTVGNTKKRPLLVNSTRFCFDDIIGRAPAMKDAVKKAKMASNSTSPVMFYGETGTGKELFAQSIHNYSRRKNANYMAINCAAIPETLLEGILFGSTKGAFTGAKEKPGLFEQANGGTLFLDEINSMPIGLQGKLLRVIQEKRVRRVGAEQEIPLDVKIISSTNVHPYRAIDDQALRKDLFFRLGVVLITIPPLADRTCDINALVRHFIRKYNTGMGTGVQRISTKVREMFKTHTWPGNVRELENAIEGAMNMVGDRKTIRVAHLTSEFHLPESGRDRRMFPVESNGMAEPRLPEPSQSHTFTSPPSDQVQKQNPEADLEKAMIEAALVKHRANVSKAAGRLGMSRQSLHRKMKKYGIDRNQILAHLEITAIENALTAGKGNISLAAKHLSISRQLLSYKMKKYRIHRHGFTE